jgi:phosphoribosylformimino-5-aminoimidazole carboxamide ribotide isomerase
VTIVPAIDLRGGRCVRLLHGDPDRESRYDRDPAARAAAFARAGARRLHVVDLDGAFGTGENLAALRAICAAVDVPVQTGGGVRTEADVRERLDAGASYVVLGTLLVEDPALARTIVQKYGNKVIAGVDVRDRAVAIRGWRESSTIDRDGFICELERSGFERVIFTEIARDGAGTGFDVAALAHVAGLAPLKITASGGAKTLADLRALVDRVPANVDSAIVGRALYEGTLDLDEAIAALAGA